ncbi:uncharacterized protein LOC135143470 isoform X1 [Zophobas morio]|uniref:uncharacterized protein LOC135143470 isoform X1 n=1 Tax=Zophobas morio TaxID=2755281 RepID=UPI003082A7CF
MIFSFFLAWACLLSVYGQVLIIFPKEKNCTSAFTYGFNEANGVNLNFFDDENLPSLAIRKLSEVEDPFSLLGIAGSFHSSVSQVIYDFLHWQGVPGISFSNSDIFSLKSRFSTFYSILPLDNIRTVYLADILERYKWTRVGIIHPSSSYFVYRTISLIQALVKRNITVVNRLEYSNIDGNFPRSFFEKKLIALRDAQIKIFILSCPVPDVLSMLRVAHELNLVGNGNFFWILYVDDFEVSVLNNWDYLSRAPYAAHGLLTFSYECDKSSDYYQNLKQREKAEPTFWQCAAFDVGYALATSIKKSLPFYGCLANSDKSTCSGLDDLHVSLQTFCSLCPKQREYRSACQSVCTKLQKNLKDGYMVYYVQLALEIFMTNFSGATGHVSFELDGGRTPNNIKVAIQNIRSNGQTYEFVTVGQVTLGNSEAHQISWTDRVVFPGGTPERPNYVSPLDRAPVRYGFTLGRVTQAILISVVVLCVLVFLALLWGFWNYRTKLVVKTSSKTMMYTMMGGALLAMTGNFALVVQLSPSSASCLVYSWTTGCGWALYFGSYILKSYRIKLIFSEETAQGKHSKSKKGNFKFTDEFLLKILGAFTVCLIVYHAIWTAVDRPRRVEFVIAGAGGEGDTVQYVCKDSKWSLALMLVEFLFVCYGLLLAYQVRSMPSYFNESKIIAFTIYNWIVLFLVSEFMLLFIRRSISQETAIIILVLTNCYELATLVGSFFGTKVYLAFRGKGDNMSKTQGRTGKETTRSKRSIVNISINTHTNMNLNTDSRTRLT